MKYDLKRLKETIDERIPAASPDESILDRALEKGAGPAGRYLSRVLTAVAACVILFAVMSVLIVPGLKTRPDDTGRSGHLLSQGVHSQPAETPKPAPTPGVAVLYEEDLSAYQVYSPDYARSALPHEAEFTDVVIRRIDERDVTYVFEDKETGEQVIPGRFDMAFAWFPATETGLIREAGSEGLTLVNVLRETLDGEYSYFQYTGNGVAVVANRDEDETQPDPMYLISTADGARLSRDYATIGTMRSGAFRLMMGHDDQDLLGDFDVLAMDGRLIARVSELGGVYFDEWLAVRLPGEKEYCLIDMQGEEQMGGMRFSRVAYEKEGMLIVWTDEGSGVIQKDGTWIFKPGRFFNIEFADGGLFRAVDIQTGKTVQISASGEPVDTLSFRLDRLTDRIGEAFDDWRTGLGQLGFAIVCASALWLNLRLGWSKENGELQHMLLTELGFAAYIAGLMLIGHRLGGEDVILWPTDTSTEGAGALAFQWNLAAAALTASLIAIFPKLRRPKQAFLTGYTLMLLPWVVKSACGDMSVMQWRAMSEVVFMGGALLAVLLFLVRPVKRFMEWCARFDSLNEYGKKTRGVWIALALIALVNFSAGCLVSGQEMEGFSCTTEYEWGMTETQNEEWFEAVNELYAEYREAGGDEEIFDLKKHDYSAIVAVRWLDEHNLEALTEEMVFSVYTSGEVRLSRPANVQLVLEAEDGESETDVWQIAMYTPRTGSDGPVEASAAFLIPTGAEAPDIGAKLYIQQRMNPDGFIAAQRYYYADCGTLLRGEGVAPWED